MSLLHFAVNVIGYTYTHQTFVEMAKKYTKKYFFNEDNRLFLKTIRRYQVLMYLFTTLYWITLWKPGINPQATARLDDILGVLIVIAILSFVLMLITFFVREDRLSFYKVMILTYPYFEKYERLRYDKKGRAKIINNLTLYMLLGGFIFSEVLSILAWTHSLIN